MKLDIFNFRCIQEKSFDFSHSGTYLLDGDNGVGKSTICYAIEWVLYGGGSNIRHHKDAERNGDPRVILCLNSSEQGREVVIDRSKNPERLSVTINGFEETQDGQALINRLFGPKHLWMACSYMPQSSWHLLVDGSEADKTKLIYEMTFGEGNEHDDPLQQPEHYIEKIKDKIKDGIEQRKAKEALIRYQGEQYDQFIATNQIQVHLLPDQVNLQNQLKRTLDRVKELRERRNKLTQVLREKQGFFSSRSTLIEQKDKFEQDFQKLDERDDASLQEIIEDLSQRKVQIDQQIGVNKEIQGLNKTLFQLGLAPELLPVLENPEQSLLEQWASRFLYSNPILPGGTSLGQVGHLIEQRLMGQAVLEQYQKDIEEIEVKYAREKELVERENNKLRLAISEGKLNNSRRELQRHKLQARQKYREALANLTPAPNDQDEASQLNRKKQIEELLRGYVCPECGLGLQLIRGQLAKGAVDLEKKKLLQGELDQVNQDLLQWGKHRIGLTLIQTLASTLPDDIDQDSEEIPEIDLAQLTRQLKPDPIKGKYPSKPKVNPVPLSDLIILRQMKEVWDNLPVQSLARLTLDQISHAFRNKGQYMVIRSKIENVLGSKGNAPLTALLKEQKELNQEIEEHQRTISQRSFIVREIENLIKQLIKAPIVDKSDLEGLEEEIRRSELELDELEKVVLLDLNNQIRVWDIKLAREKSKDELDVLLNELDNLEKLLRIVENLMFESMREICQSIQNQTNRILEIIFEEDVNDMKILIQTEKTIKGKGSTKLSINVSVIYKDVVYTALNRLSGGERSILSLALLLGMSQTERSPFLILDEAFNSISMDKRDKCLEAIEQFASDKSIISVLHGADREGYSGVYDV